LTPTLALGTNATSPSEAPMTSANSLLLLSLFSPQFSEPEPSPLKLLMASFMYASMVAMVDAGQAPLAAVLNHIKSLVRGYSSLNFKPMDNRSYRANLCNALLSLSSPKTGIFRFEEIISIINEVCSSPSRMIQKKSLEALLEEHPEA